MLKNIVQRCTLQEREAGGDFLTHKTGYNMEALPNVLVGIFLILLGLLIKYTKWYFLISGYNTMTKEEKASYDIEGIASLFRNVMLYMGGVLIFGSLLSKWTDNPSLETAAFFIAIIPGVIYLLAKSNSDTYKLKK